MGKPILEFITEHMVESVARVSIGGGYSTTLVVSEPDAVADSPQDSTALVIEADFSDEDPPAIGFDGMFQDYDVVIYVQDGGPDSTYQTRCRSYTADVTRAVMLDEQRGGYARWTKRTGARKFQDGTTKGVTVTFQVYYRTVQNCPDRLS